MGLRFDKWSLLKIFEVAFATSCLITKRVTDDEAASVFLYLQRLSREWSLLNNVTWGKVGSAVADATYGGYLIITCALLVGRLVGELPTQKRVVEIILLGIGAILFVVLGSLEFASLDSVPPDLIDNAAILGTLSLTTGALFLLDLAGPRAKAMPNGIDLHQQQQQQQPRSITRALEIHKMKSRGEPFDLEPEFARVENERNGRIKEVEESAKRFDIYGKDVEMEEKKVEEQLEDARPQKAEPEEHSPVWSKIQQGHYGKYDVVAPHFLYPTTKEPEASDGGATLPSSPGEPGYVQYTAKRWGLRPVAVRPITRQSPTQV
ncbi:PREDICTED: uncharacterized protein LOC108561054 [Nicrophorus vespilloides]|uniref:Uncharacterized protein LOC108561054 n=1 Tax=Nicrophorus vespilloides TaxID=110193 RepID=A0ABM1MIC2_NICVS|nr:PREDICTED: uncharacterized protein LOC108561054 [Nicrophorus vespilloides]XP_017774322.1 PREDICTED: uncharacterized protein LOC108561054 [Nicrophorus vespilloides]XP_017774331.1 PREDICTED: uncharacterized protein LOC108561054 [Nicrophorus vespilloides]XP_017774338.1 PREDICTED: uncharacterized protein LOC108561054 [Nicrophorus vespilloides]